MASQNTYAIAKNIEKLHLDRSEFKKMGEKGRHIAQIKFNL